MGNAYSPFEHIDPKSKWDDAILERSLDKIPTDDTKTWRASMWFYTCYTVVGMWYVQKWLNTFEYTDAIIELKSLCTAAGIDYSCMHCTSRSTIHDCKKCHSKGENNV